MGAWDVTAFGNDDASDWILDLLETVNPLEFFEKTFDKARIDSYLEAPEASEIVAAAAVVAAARNRTAVNLPENLAQWLQGREDSLKKLAPSAVNALQRVKIGSELQELWLETDDFQAWCDHLDGISSAIR
jgi:hypothetical protein